MPNYKVYYLLLPMDSWTYTVAPQGYAAHSLGTAVLDIHTICHISSSILSYHMNRKFTTPCIGISIANYTLFISYLLLLLLLPRQVQVHDLQSQRSLEWKTEYKIWRSHSHTMNIQVPWDVIPCSWVCSCLSAAGSWSLSNITKYTPINIAHIPEHVNLHETAS
jgi:hypothetical protein